MDLDRRRVLERGLAAAAVAVVGIDVRAEAAQSKRGVATPERKQDRSPPGDWAPRVPALPVGGTFDLTTTLPADVPRGGKFGVDASGASLPAGMALSETGILSVGSARTGRVVGVIFTYDTP